MVINRELRLLTSVNTRSQLFMSPSLLSIRTRIRRKHSVPGKRPAENVAIRIEATSPIPIPAQTRRYVVGGDAGRQPQILRTKYIRVGTIDHHTNDIAGNTRAASTTALGGRGRGKAERGMQALPATQKTKPVLLEMPH